MWMPAISLIASGAGCTTDPGPPDIVVVVIDTLRADHTGVYGHSRPTTPELDALAAEGLRFNRGYAHSGWTLPSFASLFTGLAPHDHKVGRDGLRPSQFGRLDDEFETLPELLKRKQYRTGAWVNNSYLAPEFGFQQGFDVYDWKGATNDNHRSAIETAALAIDWLDAADGPSFALVHFMEPHLDYGLDEGLRGHFAPVDAPPVPVPFGPSQMWFPWVNGFAGPPEPTREFLRLLYDEDVFSADRALGELASALRERDNTIVVVTSDHGEEFWDHGRFEHGHSLFSELLRVPLIVAGPGLEPSVVDTPVGHVDLFQGLIHKAGLTGSPGTIGDDLFAIAEAETFDRYVIGENTAYGPPLFTVANRSHRLVFEPVPANGNLWQIAPDGSDTKPEGDPARRKQIGNKMLSFLSGSRGGLDPTRIAGVEIGTPEVFAQLESLGYITAPAPNAVPPGINPALMSPTSKAPRAPAAFSVTFNTTKGAFRVEVKRAWAPHAADRFHRLVSQGFYDNNGLFRVLPGFIAQLGISPHPAVTLAWMSQTLPDEPRRLANEAGTLAFASQGPNTRSTQIFVNLKDNPELDPNFVPFAKIVEGFEVATSFNGRYGEGAPMGRGPSQQLLAEEGNAYLQHIYPALDYVISAKIDP